MGNYYDEIIDEIRQTIEDGRYEEALFMIEKELGMPYVPADTEEKLNALKRDVKWKTAEKRELREESTESLLNRLKQKPKSQLLAASRLSSRNLRDCTDEIRDYLSKDPVPEAAALLIEALGEQEIGEEFVYVKDGVEYTFWGDSVVPVAKSSGFLAASAYLKEWLTDKHPDIYEMCRTLLIHEAYVFLPLSYETDEAEELALQIVGRVSEMMDDGMILQEVQQKRRQPKRILN